MTVLAPLLAVDLPAVLEIERACYSAPWPAAAFEHVIADEDVVTLVARRGNRVVGYVVASCIEEILLIANLAIATAHRRGGIAGKLLDAVLEQGQRRGLSLAFLDVRRSNTAAIALYRGRGFLVVGTRPEYYSTPTEDALTMVRSVQVPLHPDEIEEDE